MQADLSLGARFCSTPPFAISGGKKPTAAQRAGLRYEEKALHYLGAWCRANGYSAQGKRWVEYRNRLGQAMWSEVDFHALSDSDDNLLLFEIKIRHTRDAFPQLKRYKALLQEIYPNRVISCIEVCQWFDPDEFRTHLLSEIRPHNLPHAAFRWEPPVVQVEGIN